MNMKILLLKYTVLYNLFREVAVTATNTRQEFGQSYSMCLCWRTLFSCICIKKCVLEHKYVLIMYSIWKNYSEQKYYQPRHILGKNVLSIMSFNSVLKGLSHEIDFKNVDINLQNLA